MNNNIKYLLISCAIAISVICITTLLLVIGGDKRIQRHKDLVEIIKNDFWEHKDRYQDILNPYGVSADQLLMVLEGSENVYTKNMLRDYAAQIPVDKNNRPKGWIIQYNINHLTWRSILTLGIERYDEKKCIPRYYENITKGYDIVIHESVHLVTWTGHSGNRFNDLAIILGKKISKEYRSMIIESCEND